jgi:hypothetical protein
VNGRRLRLTPLCCKMTSLSWGPSRAVFIISMFLALLALLVRYAHVAIPVVSTYTFETP